MTFSFRILLDISLSKCVFISPGFRFLFFSKLQSLAIPDCSEKSSHFSFSFLALTHILYIRAVVLSQ